MLVSANESTAARRRVYFMLVDATDGITAETGEAGGQPQISTNGGAWTNSEISTLSSIGNGRYYADLTQTAVATAGDIIETRYKSANTAEAPGDTYQVVAFSLVDAVRGATGTALPAVASGSAGAVITSGTGTAQLAVAGGTANAQVKGMDADTVTASALATDAVNEIVDQTWDEAIAGHLTAGSTGKTLSDAGTAGDVWSVALPGAYGAGTAGKIVGDNLNATVSSRATDSGVVTALFATVTEGALTFIQAFRLMSSALFGKASGMDTTTGTFRDFADTKNRIVVTQDEFGNRSNFTTRDGT